MRHPIATAPAASAMIRPRRGTAQA